MPTRAGAGLWGLAAGSARLDGAAAGAMLADTMIPEAFEEAHTAAGPITIAGSPPRSPRAILAGDRPAVHLRQPLHQGQPDGTPLEARAHLAEHVEYGRQLVGRDAAAGARQRHLPVSLLGGHPDAAARARELGRVNEQVCEHLGQVDQVGG